MICTVRGCRACAQLEAQRRRESGKASFYLASFCAVALLALYGVVLVSAMLGAG